MALLWLAGPAPWMAAAASPPSKTTTTTTTTETTQVVDPLDAFGKALTETKGWSLSGWPDSPSPLPTLSRSAADLTSPANPPDAQEEDETSLAGAIEKAEKQKVMEPLTHG